MGEAFAFWILAIVAVTAAVLVVALQNVFRSALGLVAMFLAVAGIYVTLSADFLAAVQVLVYVGAISVLIILAIMLTKRVQSGSPANKLRLPAIITSVAAFIVITYALVNTQWNVSATAPLENTTQTLADKLFGQGGFILPVQISAVLILVTVIGAIVLAKGKQK